jgi:Polyketide cyclase / dehydrase and lipid transport
MFKKVAIGIAAALTVLVLGLVGIVAMQPSEFHIERSAKMAAAPDKIFEQVNDFHKWNDWSPWAKLDPNAQNSFEGPAAGAGAIFRWAGNAEVGEGSMTILESRPPEHVRIELHFVKPFEDTATTEFKLRPEGEQTTVTWSMDGKNNFISKAFCLLIMDMEQMIGGKYEEGLASLKKIVEAPEPAAPSDESAKPDNGASGKSN